eukprot:TRINITY_DN3626_c0_g1_i1.p1 TRINITY_DN3626_c0_g1~~TRINITY_DN3626_c0_g1_i1.p1  ORF type:complete len:377 (+),score=126.68 TRINITY_DN3626_c0_g1_i1:28-1131(+)
MASALRRCPRGALRGASTMMMMSSRAMLSFSGNQGGGAGGPPRYAGAPPMQPHQQQQQPPSGLAVSHPNLIPVDGYNFQRMLMSPDPLFLFCYSPRDPTVNDSLDVLNELASKAKDKCVFGALNVDDNLKIAQMIGLQQVPFTIVIKGGQGVNGFPGEIEKESFVDFVEQLHLGFSLKSEADAFENFLKEAKAKEAARDISGAASMYSKIMNAQAELDDLPKFKARAVAGLARVALLENNRGAAEDIIEMLKNDHANFLEEPEVASAIFSVSIFEEVEKSPFKSLEDAQKATTDDPKNVEALYYLGVLELSAGHYEQGIESVLKAVRKDRRWNEEAAKKLLMQVFSALGPSHPIAIKGRRRLANMIF